MSSASKASLLRQLENRLGYTFSDQALLTAALTHRSAGKSHNERLEFLGDSLVNHVVAVALFRQFPEASEGQLSRLRAKIVRGSHLAEIALRLDVGAALILGTGERKSGGRNRHSILADALEAISAAILLDAGFEVASAVLMAWFEPSIGAISLTDERDPKTRLQEWLQGNGHPVPEYDVLAVTGEDHSQEFLVSCKVTPFKAVWEGRGTSRRQAEQDAAVRVLEHIEHGS